MAPPGVSDQRALGYDRQADSAVMDYVIDRAVDRAVDRFSEQATSEVAVLANNAESSIVDAIYRSVITLGVVLAMVIVGAVVVFRGER